VDPKPERFSSMTERLDYLYPNVHRRMSQPLRAADAYFALDPETPIEPPQMQFRLRLFGTIRQGQAMDFKFSPDLKIDVEMPNLEERFRLFVETARASDLPARYASELTDRGLNIGARKWFEELGVSADAGVRARWVPEAFIRVVWSRKWVAGEWGIRPEQRVFLESDDGLGTLSSVFLSRWLGARQEAVLLQNTSVKWTTRTEAWDWAASVDWARIESLLDESQRGRSVGWGDTARAWGARYAVFGQEGDLETHRATLRVRVPLYQRWIFLEADPGVEWYRGGSDGLIGVVRLGLDMLFWGHAVGSR
ncbi:MAG: hypothetical protein U1E27_01920, partial [Kiritimatiellia bacterium]|nr:hypothetical protein [Kiritimatiellia bacterium]